MSERFDPDAFLIGKQARLADWEFKKEQREFTKLCAVLRATKWNKEHPERHRELGREYARKPEVRQRNNARKKAQRAAKPWPVRVCLECHCEFPQRRRNATVPKFCGNHCRQNYRYHERHPNAKRIKRRVETPGGGEFRRDGKRVHI